MIKTALIIGIIFFNAVFSVQDIQQEATAINIEVPVRVFDGNVFVDNLTIDDFKIFEDGMIQEIEAVYLINKNTIKREEKGNEEAPNVSRTFILDFEITEYIPEIDKVLDYFFNEVILPGDRLFIASPVNIYSYLDLQSDEYSKRENANRLKLQIRTDLQNYLPELRNLRRNLIDIYTDDSNRSAESRMLPHILAMLKEIRQVDQRRLIEFADLVKKIKGRKFVFLFYQREVIPMPEIPVGSRGADLGLEDWDLSLSLDTKKIRQAFFDPLVTLNLIFITKPQEFIQELRGKMINTSRIRMEEQSKNILSSFREILDETGGSIDVALNAASSFRRIVETSENYYLLYYSPINYRNDGKYKRIKVRVKNKNFKITYRKGYYAE